MRNRAPVFVVLLLLSIGFLCAPVLAEEKSSGDADQVRRAYALMAEGRHGDARELLAPLLLAHPPDPMLQYDQAFSFYLEGNFFWAQRHLMMALEIEPDCRLCHRLMALNLARTGQWDAALEEMRLFEKLGGRDASGWAELIAGVVLYKKQEFDKARDYFRGLPDSSGPSILDMGNLYLEAIARMKGASYKPYDGYVGLGMVYDTNVSLEPDVSGVEFSGAGAAFGTVVTAGLSVRPIRKQVVLEGWGTWYKSTYFAETANQYAVTQARAGLKGIVPSWADLELGYDYSLTILGPGEDFWGPLWTGDAKVEKPDFYVFQEVHGLHLAARFRPSDNIRLSPRYVWSYKFHDLMRRDVMEHLVDLSGAFFFLDGRLRLYVIPRAFVDQTVTPEGRVRACADSDERPLTDAYDTWGVGLLFRLSAALPHDFSLVASAGLGYTDYYNSAGDFDGILDKRQDFTLLVGIGASWAFSNAFSLSMGYSFLRSYSSIPRFDYPSHMFNLGTITWRYPW